MTHLKRDVIVLFGETLSSNPGKSTVRAQSSANSSSLISDDTILLKRKNLDKFKINSLGYLIYIFKMQAAYL